VGLREVRYGLDGENHLQAPTDESNPYFSFDPARCILCSRCVRACEEIQGTFALTIAGRGFGSRVAAGQDESFMASDCVSCGACVQACPTATLQEKSVIELGQPEHSVITTCAYCGVGCSFKAELRGGTVVRMTPHKDGKANRGHSCVKGRFAFGYATHRDRITTPLVARAHRPAVARGVVGGGHRVRGHAPARDPARVRPQQHRRDHLLALHQRGNLAGAEAGARGLPQQQRRHLRARVPFATGYGLKTTLGESAGTQAFDSVDDADVIIVMGANPTDAHPVFASRLKRRLRAGAQLIVVDPRRIELVSSPHIRAAHTCSCVPAPTSRS